MAIAGFIYDTETGACIARMIDNGDVLDATQDNGQKIGTVDGTGNVYDLEGDLIGHLEQAQKIIGGLMPEAFRKLLASRKKD